MSVNDNTGSPEGTKYLLADDPRLKDPINLFNARRRASELNEAKGELLGIAATQSDKATQLEARERAVAKKEELHKEYGSAQAAKEELSRKQNILDAGNEKLEGERAQLKADQKQLKADKEQLEAERRELEEQQRTLGQQMADLERREKTLASSKAVLENVSDGVEATPEDKIASAKLTKRFKGYIESFERDMEDDLETLGNMGYLAGDGTKVTNAQKACLLETRTAVLTALACYSDRFPGTREAYQNLIQEQLQKTFSEAKDLGATVLHDKGDTLSHVADRYVGLVYDFNESAILESADPQGRFSSAQTVEASIGDRSSAIYRNYQNNGSFDIPTVRELCGKFARDISSGWKPVSVNFELNPHMDQNAITEVANKALQGIDARLDKDGDER